MLAYHILNMGKGKRLSDQEKGIIDGLKLNNWSHRDIAAEINRSPSVVDSYVRDSTGYGTKKHSGRKPKTTKRNRRAIIQTTSNSTATSSKIKADLNLGVSSRTIRRVLSKSKLIARRRMRKAPFITPINQKKRLDFADKNRRIDWSSVSQLSLCFINFLCFRSFGQMKRNSIVVGRMVVATIGTTYVKTNCTFRGETSKEEE